MNNVFLRNNLKCVFILFLSISILGKYNYTAADFVRQDVFNTIRAYLSSGNNEGRVIKYWNTFCFCIWGVRCNSYDL